MQTVPASARACAATLCAFLSLPALAAKKPLTLDAIMNEGGHADHGPVTWSPDGQRFVHEDAGRVMLYDPAARRDTELFRLEAMEHAAAPVPEDTVFNWQNRRVEKQSMDWAAGGASLVVSVKGDLFLWSFGASKWEQLTHTPEPEMDAKISPDSRSVVFRRGHDLYLLDVASKAVTRITQDGSPTTLNGQLDWVYPEELDLGTALWWSSDSKRVAYMQFDISHEFVYPQVVLTGLRAVFEPEHYPQAGTPNPDVRVGIVALDDPTHATHWMNTGAAADMLLARVDWLRDSDHLAIQRLNRIQNRLDVLIADAQTGNSRTILHEEDRCWINISNVYAFLQTSDEFIWSSERDGFRHLYLYNTDGRLRRQLTEGPWEVTNLTAVDERARRVWFLSTEATPLERHLYTVSLDGGERARLTQRPGTHQINMSRAGGFWLDDFSSFDSPPETTLHAPGGDQVTVWQKQDRSFIDQYDVPSSEFLKIAAEDGTPLYARLIRPADFQPGRRYPLAVMVYGGPQVQVVSNSWKVGLEQLLAARGFVVWSLDGRGSAGRGHAFEIPLYRRFGRTELADQVTGVHYLINKGIADPQHIGIFGWSYGGFMTLYSLLNAPDLFRAGIAGAPVTNWHNYDTIYTERYLGLPADNEDAYKLSSPVTDAAQLRGRLLILHNMEDDNVLFQNSMQMADALEKAGKEFAMVVYPQKSHGVEGAVRRQLMQTQVDFFERELK